MTNDFLQRLFPGSSVRVSDCWPSPCTAIYLWLRFFSVLIFLHAATLSYSRSPAAANIITRTRLRAYEQIETQNSFNNNANFHEKVRATTRNLNLTRTDKISMPLRSKNARTSGRIQFADRLRQLITLTTASRTNNVCQKV